MRYLPLLAFCCLCACKKNEPTTTLPGNLIQFDDMALGQKSYYVRLNGEGFRDQAPFDFTYVADTLLVEVVAQSGDEFTLKESLTNGSVSIVSPDKVTPPFGGTNPHVYRVKKENGNLRYLDMVSGEWQPRLFPKPDWALPLDKQADLEVAFQGWMPGADTNINEGMVRDFKVGDKSFDRLNFFRNYDDMAFDGNGFFSVYSAETGIVRAGTVSSWGAPGQAWDLLADFGF